jgi:hypothetical protein
MIGAAGSQTPVEVIVVLSIVVPLGLLALVSWIFWRARHDD